MTSRVVLLCALLLCAAPAAAQNVINPRWVEFTPSTDHGAVQYYELRFYQQGATQPMFSHVLGKPTPDASNVCRVDINTLVIGLPYGNGYTARVVALNSLGEGVSAPSNPFDVAAEPQPPAPPTGVVLKR